ncbi:MAG: response regulator [Pseudobdellovibrionaceae bacterium]|jgi:DNA-binding NarL/FixJ family response regulator
MALKCLIVDDAGFIREILCHAVETNGDVVVGECSDGGQVAELVTKLSPEVIFLDLVLPKFNGIEIARWVRENAPETKIIAVSTLDDETTIAQAFEAGASLYIRKPFKQHEIKEALNKIRKNEVNQNV